MEKRQKHKAYAGPPSALSEWLRQQQAEARPTDNDPVGRHNTEFPQSFHVADRTRVPADRLRKPLPSEAPPAPYWTTAANGIGMQFHAIVVPLPVRYCVLEGLPAALETEDPMQLLALEVARLVERAVRAEDRVRELEGALRPLTAPMLSFREDAPDSIFAYYAATGHEVLGPGPEINVGEVRRARALLNG